MTALTSAAPSPRLSVVDGHATTTSLQVAEYFGKRHDHVLRDIRNLIEQTPPEYHLPNFGEMVETRLNPSGGAPITSPAYTITRDGFTLLAMGFTGKKALAFKLAYITAFNQMERQLRSTPPDPTRGLRAADMLTKTAKALRDSGIPKQQALAQALEEVHRQTGVRMLPDYTPEKAKAQHSNSQIIKYIQNAKRYAKDARFGTLCAQGVMPHSKLLKLLAVSAQEFAEVIDQAINEGLIEERRVHGYSGSAYALVRQ